MRKPISKWSLLGDAHNVPLTSSVISLFNHTAPLTKTFPSEFSGITTFPPSGHASIAAWIAFVLLSTTALISSL